MYKKHNLLDLNIPIDDIDCWNRYPKHRWVYDLSRLLDSQNIKWSPFEQEGYERKTNIELFSISPINISSGYIYTIIPQGRHIISEIYIIKGEIKHIEYTNENKEEISQLIGELELRLNAFITLYFKKFTGVITIDSIGNEIFKVRLRPQIDTIRDNTESLKLLKKIYKTSIQL